MANQDQGPRPICIIKPIDGHRFELDENNLASILMQESVRDKSVVVVSIAGASRKGKSSLLNFYLRYLTHGVKTGFSSSSDNSWLSTDDEPLTGFHWRGGSDTTGILMWSEPFVVRVPSGEEVAVLLMDTQGSFDTKSTVKDCATIFALSMMISSVQVYNISQNIQENDLQHLHLFTEYGRLALEHSEHKPFQVLQFLVRDWGYRWEKEYGAEGGAKLLQSTLNIDASQQEDLKGVRTHIRDCFEKVTCFLMPHPGKEVATSPIGIKLQLKNIDDDFKNQLLDHVSALLAPKNLVMKEITGSKVTCSELMGYFKVYMKVFQGDSLPEPKSILSATAEANNLATITKAKNMYVNDMENICGGEKFMDPNALIEEHNRLFKDALKLFNETQKMVVANYANFQTQLENELLELWEAFQNNNKIKKADKERPLIYFYN